MELWCDPMADDAGIPAVRASDVEREAAIERLREAAGEGRLTFEELADRVEAAASAVTRGDLERLTQDLPEAPAAAVSSQEGAPTRASTVFGGVRRTGAWTVPVEGRWESLFGDIVLDLREARVTGPEVHIDAGTIFGNVDLLVPEGVEVEVRSRTLFGDIKQEAAEAAPAGAPKIVLTGGTVFGDVRVRALRLRERLVERLAQARRGHLDQPGDAAVGPPDRDEPPPEIVGGAHGSS
jgi:Domain of unknown function (DUF1707)/Cell wall-active antibiotics response 4TMS YvqF